MTDPDERPSPAELIETPPDRVTLQWCGTCGFNAPMYSPVRCPVCGHDRAAVTYEWVDE